MLDLKVAPILIVITGMANVLFGCTIIEYAFVGVTILNSMITGAFHYLEDLEIVYRSRKSISIEWTITSIISAAAICTLINYQLIKKKDVRTRDGILRML